MDRSGAHCAASLINSSTDMLLLLTEDIKSVDDEGEEDEGGEDLLNRARTVDHQLAEIEEDVEEEEEAVPEAHGGKQIEKVHLEALRYAVHYLRVEAERRRRGDDHQRLAGEEGKDEAADGLPQQRLLRAHQRAGVLLIDHTEGDTGQNAGEEEGQRGGGHLHPGSLAGEAYVVTLLKIFVCLSSPFGTKMSNATSI
ncbi:hypothetical protein TYRP_006593 [Tyrophagus putrescentiae]|nr:hypothetical protein TYRP_006593 [Tyrophagus putrescentiae]